MCGIWGWWRQGGAPPPDGAEIERITLPMRPRGPDDFGSWRSHNRIIYWRERR